MCSFLLLLITFFTIFLTKQTQDKFCVTIWVRIQLYNYITGIVRRSPPGVPGRAKMGLAETIIKYNYLTTIVGMFPFHKWHPLLHEEDFNLNQKLNICYLVCKLYDRKSVFLECSIIFYVNCFITIAAQIISLSHLHSWAQISVEYFVHRWCKWQVLRFYFNVTIPI